MVAREERGHVPIEIGDLCLQCLVEIGGFLASDGARRGLYRGERGGELRAALGDQGVVLRDLLSGRVLRFERAVCCSIRAMLARKPATTSSRCALVCAVSR